MNHHMRSWSMAFTILGLLLGLAVSPLLAKSYRIESVKIEALVNPDGSMDIREDRTYRFQGSFSWAEYKLPIEGFSSVEDFRLWDQTGEHLPDRSEEPGTYQILSDRGEFHVKWFYRASDETRTFSLAFRATDVVKVYADIAELYYKFIGTGWDHASNDVYVLVKLPPGASEDDIRAWAHGPLWGNVRIVNGQTVELAVSQLPAGQFWEGRVVFPIRLVPEALMTDSSTRLPIIMEEEARWAEEANQKRLRAQEAEAAAQQKSNHRKRQWLIGLVALSAIAVFFWARLYLRLGRNFPTSFRGKLYSDIPSDLAPALVGYFMGFRQISAASMLATLLDLARRGYLSMREERKREKVLFWEQETSDYILELNREHFSQRGNDLETFERDLIEFLFVELSQGRDTIWLSDLKKARTATQKWFRRWRGLVTGLAKQHNFYDRESISAMYWGLIIGFAMIAISIFALTKVGEVGLVSLIVGAGLIPASLVAIPRMSREFADEYAQWKGLRNYLKSYHFRGPDIAGLAQHLDRFLAYAIVMGLSTRRIRDLVSLGCKERGPSIFPWYIYASSRGQADFGAAFGEAMSSMVSIAGSSLSSATGAGGGASGGGGGGGGGSGGGAG